jgi:hypothetical protein
MFNLRHYPPIVRRPAAQKGESPGEGARAGRLGIDNRRRW